MESITLENEGLRTIRNPRLLINGKGNWWTPEEAVAEIVGEVSDPLEKAYRTWYFLSQHRFNFQYSPRHHGGHDSFLHLHSYGHGVCGHSVSAALPYFRAAGLDQVPEGGRLMLRELRGHAVLEVPIGKRRAVFDVDKRTFYLDRENLWPVAGDAIARDHDLARRELVGGPVHDDWTLSQVALPAYGRDDVVRPPLAKASGDPVFLLRPGEKITYTWRRARHWWGRRPPLGSLATLHWRPLKSKAPLEATFEEISGFEREGIQLVAASDHPSWVLSSEPPWATAKAEVSFMYDSPNHGASAALELSLDGSEWETLWQHEGQAEGRRVGVDLSKSFPPPAPRTTGRRSIRLRLSLQHGAGARVKDLRLRSKLMTASHLLPSLRAGDNLAKYIDDTGEDVALGLRIEWTQWSGSPPEPPASPLSPATGSVVAATFPRFSWPADPAIEAWHLMVSQRPDFAWPWRPNYDVILPDPSYEVPFRGMFSSGETYYWRVRPRTAGGVWGAWGPTWSFSWKGPMVPRDVSFEEQDGRRVLRWQPNPRGTVPVRYRVFGSDEKGFSISGESDVFEVGTTDGQELTVVDGQRSEAGFNRAFYRVVAVDAQGVESTPSEALELPRPFLYQVPPATAEVGKPYQARIASLISQGDLQRRYPSEKSKGARHEFFEKEVPRYELLEGPSWLRLDPDTGELSGVPATADVGKAELKIQVRLTYPFEVSREEWLAKLFPPIPEKTLEETFEITIEDR